MHEEENEEKTATPKQRGYDDIKPGGGNANDIPPGRYEAILLGAILQEPTENGQSLRLNFKLCTEDLVTNEVPTWFKFYRGDGSINEFAISLWKTALVRLGYKDVKEEDLPELLEQLSEDRPGAVIKISYQTVKGYANPLQRVEVEGPCDNDVIASYRDKHEASF
jgi:hypothetical protein